MNCQCILSKKNTLLKYNTLKLNYKKKLKTLPKKKQT
jgi:hypothetical protein